MKQKRTTWTIVAAALWVVATFALQPAPAQAETLSPKGCLDQTIPWNGSGLRVMPCVNQSNGPANYRNIEGYAETNGGLDIDQPCDSYKLVEIKLYKVVSGPDVLLRDQDFNLTYACSPFAQVHSTSWYEAPDCNTAHDYRAQVNVKVLYNGAWSGLVGRSSLTVHTNTC